MLCFFSKDSGKFATSLPRQHSAAIGCTNYYQPIGGLYTRIALRALKVSYSDVGEVWGGGELWKKTQIFPEHPVDE